MSTLPALCLAAALAFAQVAPEQNAGERLHNLIATDRWNSQIAPDKYSNSSGC